MASGTEPRPYESIFIPKRTVFDSVKGIQFLALTYGKICELRWVGTLTEELPASTWTTLISGVPTYYSSAPTQEYLAVNNGKRYTMSVDNANNVAVVQIYPREGSLPVGTYLHGVVTYITN